MIRESLRVIELDSVTGVIEFLASRDSVTIDLDDTTNFFLVRDMSPLYKLSTPDRPQGKCVILLVYLSSSNYVNKTKRIANY